MLRCWFCMFLTKKLAEKLLGILLPILVLMQRNIVSDACCWPCMFLTKNLVEKLLYAIILDARRCLKLQGNSLIMCAIAGTNKGE